MGQSPYAGAWAHFDLNLGLTADLLPVVSDPDVAISPNSKMKSKGKTPSIVNGGGMAAGLPSWTAKTTRPAEVDRWAADPRLGMCIQTRRVRAIDIDISDPVLADAVEQHLENHLGVLPCRVRGNSGKRLLAFIVEGEHFKRAWKGEGGLIEFLANGQQFVAAGPHYDSRTGQPSGADYEWRDGLPDTLPVLKAEDVFDALDAASENFRFARIGRDETEMRRRGEDLGVDDPRLDWLLANLEHQHGFDRNGALMFDCPWKDGHSGDSGITETVYFPAGTNGYEQGHYRCLHAGCSGRTDYEFDIAVGREEGFEPLPDQPETLEATGEMVWLQAVPADEFAQRPALRWIVRNVLPEAQLGMIYGASGAGKSFFVLDLAAAVALGQPWRGNRVRQMKVVYVCAEGAGGFRNRVEAYRRQHGVAFGDQLHVIAGQPNFLANTDSKIVANEVKRIGAGIVIIDTLAQVTPGGDENSAQDMGKAIKKCRQISEATGAMVLLVHHAGKDAARGARGWSGIRAAADTEIEVSLHKTGVRVARLTKQKDGQDGVAYGFTLETVAIGADEDGDMIESCVTVEADVPVTDEQGERLVRAEPKGKVQKLVWAVFQDEVGTDGGVDAMAFFDAATATVMEKFGHDRRRAKGAVSQAIVGLREENEDGFAWLTARDGRLYGDEIS